MKSRTRPEAVDPVPALPDRAQVLRRLAASLEAAARSDREVGVLYLGLDRFGRINQSLGYALGDELLDLIGMRLRRALRSGDLVGRESSADRGAQVGRAGGDRFVVLLAGLDRAEAAAPVAQRLLDRLGQPFSLRGRTLRLSASIGIATSLAEGSSPQGLLQRAEAAMSHAKARGGGCLRYFGRWMNVSARRQLELEQRLQGAVARDELEVHFQPVLGTRLRRILGVEALLRWRCPDLGAVEPDEFIPVAEEAGLMPGIGEWVFSTACRQLRRWSRPGRPDLRLSVNLSGRQLGRRDLPSRFGAILRRERLQADRVEVELSERQAVCGDQRAATSLSGLRDLGLRIAVDDFGSGHSSLGYLRDLPLDTLKIDRSFISGSREGSRDGEIVSAIIAMAHRLGLAVVAEGVETEEQLQFLRRQQCDAVQGFLFSRPLPPDELEDLLIDRDRVRSRGPVRLVSGAEMDDLPTPKIQPVTVSCRRNFS